MGGEVGRQHLNRRQIIFLFTIKHHGRIETGQTPNQIRSRNLMLQQYSTKRFIEGNRLFDEFTGPWQLAGSY